MHEEQRQRAQERLAAAGMKRALFANRQSVSWLTGFAPPVQTGPDLFAGGPPLVWYEDGHFTLLVIDGQAGAAGDFHRWPNCELRTYEGYTIQKPITGAQNLADLLRQVLSSGGRGDSVGVEMQSMTLFLKNAADQALGEGTQWRTIDDWLIPLRMVKTAEELEKLRHNFTLTDIGHAAARSATSVDAREIDVWTAIHTAVEQEAGERVPLGNDCVVSYRQNNIGGWPKDLALRAGDSLMVDLSTIRFGYWSDSCATYYAAEPTQAQSQAHRMAEKALDYAISLIKPGAISGEIDRKVRQFVEDAGYPAYPHHTGHGVGLSGHEEPRIVPYNDVVLQPGMVIMLEPGTYIPGEAAVRLEDAVLVTPDGAQVLTQHDKGLP